MFCYNKNGGEHGYCGAINSLSHRKMKIKLSKRQSKGHLHLDLEVKSLGLSQLGSMFLRGIFLLKIHKAIKKIRKPLLFVYF